MNSTPPSVSPTSAPQTSLRIGTRGSPLALAQAHQVRDELIALGHDASALDIKIFKTTGDKILDRPLSEVGGKGLFTKELEDALLANEIDIAVHSMKDVATQLPDGLRLAVILPREDVRDAFISLKYKSLDDLPKGAHFGTSSLRRQSQILNIRPDLEIVPFRGNVQTRLQKLADNVADATLLAFAGLKRLNLADRATAIIDDTTLLPACAQGAIGIEIRAADNVSATAISRLDHQQTHIAVITERAFLRVLDGSCRTPIAGLAQFDGQTIHFRGQVLSPDGKRQVQVERTGSAREAIRLGEDAAAEILRRAGPDLLGARP